MERRKKPCRKPFRPRFYPRLPKPNRPRKPAACCPPGCVRRRPSGSGSSEHPKMRRSYSQPPPSKMLVGILDEMGRGNTVTVIPVHAELTTQQAADMLDISRPSLIQMLDEGKIEYRKVGTHRRVRFESVMAYKRKVHAERLAALNELAAYDQEIGI